ncbi:hypothetical protein ZBT109_1590 [Zymobacter palmae]|uniref:Secreted protein n=1 Tax=Zymobacter palmae TaxID=33074 RepID=A0A348HFE5_9GAMM|nr:hypothetical protein ZBT109_1590 [Zymobacter palmae]
MVLLSALASVIAFARSSSCVAEAAGAFDVDVDACSCVVDASFRVFWYSVLKPFDSPADTGADADGGVDAAGSTDVMENEPVDMEGSLLQMQWI